MLILFSMMLFLHCLTTIFIRSGMKEYLVLAKVFMYGCSFLKCKGNNFFLNFCWKHFDDKTGYSIWEMFTLFKGVPDSFRFVLFLVRFMVNCSGFQCTSFLLRSSHFCSIQSRTTKFLKYRLVQFKPMIFLRFIFTRMRIQTIQNMPLPELRGHSCLEGGRCLDSKA